MIALALLWWRHSEQRQVALMAATATSRAGDVGALAPGTFVEVKGTLRCAQPLKAEFSQRSSAYFKAEIYERRVTYTTGSDGKQRQNTTSHAIHSNCQFAPCTVEDDSGKVALNLDGADVEGETAVDRTEAAGGALMTTVLTVAGGPRVNHHHIEKILPHDIAVYVLGEVQADRSVGKPAEGSKNGTFIVSIKSEEARSAEASSTAKWLLIVAGVLFAIAAGLLVWARIKGAG